MRKYYIKTFGCEMNQADSEKVNMILLQSWMMKTNDWRDADLVVYNTCSVRQKWEDRVFGMSEEIKKENNKRKENGIDRYILTAITGCMVRKSWINAKYLPEENKRKKAKVIEYIDSKEGIFNNDDKLFPRLPTLDFTFRIEEVKYITFILTHILWEKIWSDDKFDDYLKARQLRENSKSASVIIQTGCDNYCTFCIVPYTRWKEISREHDDIIQEVKELAANGTKEISLVGQNVNSYWKQKNIKLWNEEKSAWNEGVWISPFRKILDDINAVEWIDRIRFTSSNPHDMTQDILDAHFDLDATCNYLHFALQSWDDKMLKKMNRRHNYEDFKNMVEYLRSKDPLFSISTDIIVGYSWETEEMFQNTVKAFKECKFDFAFIARYSVRPGTIASKVLPDDVPDEVKAQRWHILNDLLLENLLERNKLMLDKTFEIMVAWNKDGSYFGRTRNFKEVFFKDESHTVQVGDLVNVKITDLDRYVLQWELVK